MFYEAGKSDQAARCIESRIMNKVIDLVLSIDTFEQKCVMLKGMLQSPRLKHHVQAIGIYQSLSKNAIYEHKCIENNNKIYKQAGKCDFQQQFKYILEGAMFYTPYEFTNNSPIYPMTSTPIKKPSAQKSLCFFTNILDVKKTACLRVEAGKFKRKAIKFGNKPWALK